MVSVIECILGYFVPHPYACSINILFLAAKVQGFLIISAFTKITVSITYEPLGHVAERSMLSGRGCPTPDC
jgi:hypothetical protein